MMADATAMQPVEDKGTLIKMTIVYTLLYTLPWSFLMSAAAASFSARKAISLYPQKGDPTLWKSAVLRAL